MMLITLQTKCHAQACCVIDSVSSLRAEEEKIGTKQEVKWKFLSHSKFVNFRIRLTSTGN